MFSDLTMLSDNSVKSLPTASPERGNMEKKAIVICLCECIEKLRKACAPESYTQAVTHLLIESDSLPTSDADTHLLHFYSDTEPTIECCIARLDRAEVKECLRKAEFLLASGFDNARTHFIIKQLSSRLVNSKIENNILPESEEEEEI